MRVTTFTDEANRTGVHVAPSPAWEPFDEYDGKPLEGVRLMVVERLPLGERLGSLCQQGRSGRRAAGVECTHVENCFAPG